MKVEVRLNTGEPHTLLFHAETDGERKLLQIVDGNYVVKVTPIERDGYYVKAGPDGLRLDLYRNTP